MKTSRRLEHWSIGVTITPLQSMEYRLHHQKHMGAYIKLWHGGKKGAKNALGKNITSFDLNFF